MADTKISALTDGTTADATDRIPVARDPTGTPLSRYITPAYINTYLIALSNTWTGANVFSPSGDVIEQYRSTNAQSWRLYNTRTDASNYERLSIYWSSNQLNIRPENAGTGSLRHMQIGVDGASNVYFCGTNIRATPNFFEFTNTRGIEFVGTYAGYLKWNSVGIAQSATGIIKVTNGSTGGGSLEFIEQTAPSAPSTNAVRIYSVDNGSGKTQLMALFATGAAQQLAIEP